MVILETEDRVDLSAAIVSCAIPGCITLLFFLVYRHQRNQVLPSLSWPQATGTISRSRVERIVHGGYRLSTVYAPRVIYLYEVYGVSHVGTRIRFACSIPNYFATEKEAQRVLVPYPEKSEVTVYYDPADPEKAVLDRELPSPRIVVFFGSFFVLILLVLLALVVLERSDPYLQKAHLARTQTHIQARPEPEPEPPADIGVRRDVNVKSEPVVVPKDEPKVQPALEPKIVSKAGPPVDRAASIELYGALRAKKPLPVIEALLNRNPAINGVSPFNVPLVAAAEGCEPEAARLLLAKGADPNAPYTKGMASRMNQPTALMAASAGGCVSVAQVLLESGANPNVTTEQPALVEAVEHKSEQMARLLLDHGADPDAFGYAGPSPLGAAVSDSNEAMVRLLLTHGAKVNQADGLGKTALGHSKDRPDSPQMQRIVMALRNAGATE